MDLRFTADELAFRDELREFFRDNLPGDISERVRLGNALRKLREVAKVLVPSTGSSIWPLQILDSARRIVD